MSNIMNITMIPADKLYSHPQNPRTDLGDITELTDSIKVMGILQNLTVVPYNSADHAGITIADGDGSDCFVIVVGNRRHAAGIKAGVSEFPCAVSGMDLKEQIRTMQVENILREGLTTYQEAKAIQTMLDMGDTVEEIAKATGFSKSKVEKRAKLAVFDEAAFAESEKRNPTMKDYLDLAKVEDADERNKLLESIGTANFRDDLARAKSRIKSRKEREAQIAVIETFAQRVENEESDFRSVRTIYSNDKAADIKAPTDLDIHEYFYVEKSWAIMVYRRKTPGEISAAKDAEQEAAKLKAAYLQLEEASKRTFELRIAFMEALTAAKAKKCFATIAKHLADYLRDLTFRGYVQLKIDHHLAADLLGVSMAEKTGVDADEVKELAQKYPERTLLILCYLQLEDNNLSYAKQEWKGSKWVPFHRDCDGLDRIYELLTDIGYQMSDEEKQLQDGTHPLFYQEQPKQENAAA